jgi:hypothetical protein
MTLDVARPGVVPVPGKVWGHEGFGVKTKRIKANEND